MTEEQFKAVFIASWSAARLGPEHDVVTFRDMMKRADVAWRLYSESRAKVEVDPGYASLWFGLNWPALHEALIEADHATLLKVAELVGYTPMEPR